MNIKYIHEVGPSGPSANFPSPSTLEADCEVEGWPQGSVRCHWVHEEHCATLVLDNGEMYTFDCDGYGEDEHGRFYVSHTGIDRDFN